MFDPTVFDNLKTVLEGAVYDLDLSGEIYVTSREDLVDLARFSRTYKIAFRLRELGEAGGEAIISLKTELKHVAGELIEETPWKPGCAIEVAFILTMEKPEEVCGEIQKRLENIWGENRSIRQTLSRSFPPEQRLAENRITVQFNRFIDESNVSDLHEMIPFIILSLRELDQFRK